MGQSVTRLFTVLRFKKSPDVYKQRLAEIDKEIQEMQQKKIKLEYQYNLIAELILSYSRLLYFIAALIFFFTTLPSTAFEYVLFCGPLLVFIFLITGLKKSLKWYFDNEVARITKKIDKLKFQKEKVLLEVKQKVKFSEARHIIEEYSAQSTRNSVSGIINDEFMLYSKRKRQSSFDNVVKYVLREEKENSLLCKHCKYHNGMAMAEDFNFVSFRCCRCSKMNDAKIVMKPAIKQE